MLKLQVQAQQFPVAGTFTISRGSTTAANVIWVSLSAEGHSGQGEGVPYGRYGETVELALAALERARPQIESGITQQELPSLNLPKGAQNALDCALWDLQAKRNAKPAWQLAGVRQPAARLTAYTLSLDTPENMGAAAARAHLPLLKLKLGRDGDEDRLEAVRKSAPHARLIVDANEGWRLHNVEAMIQCCAMHGIELIEQPLPADQDEILKSIPRSITICADESAHDRRSLPALKGKYDAVNIKLDKTGGLTEALAMARAAKADGFKILVGCMVATSLSMAPAFLVAQLADFVDLDGPLLLAKDRDPAISYSMGSMQPPQPALWG